MDYNKGSDARCEPTSFKHACSIIWDTIFATIYITVYSIYNIKKQQVRLYKTLYIVQCGIPTYMYIICLKIPICHLILFVFLIHYGLGSVPPERCDRPPGRLPQERAPLPDGAPASPLAPPPPAGAVH